ncbi:MAG TPA: TetR/AcrR family transcriptional regulator C-terminal domain-containing protein, partial [Pseudonocardia sp.]|nr:TetR/AcrR family transcriptional regulator C-terminal domain-containing protein [Pseudonocardia sp.]
LADAGLGPEDAARASYLLTVHVLGSVALEVAELDEPGPPPPEEERVAARAAAFAAVPAERYPRSAGVAATMARYVTSEQFRWGLDRVLDGLTPG